MPTDSSQVATGRVASIDQPDIAAALVGLQRIGHVSDVLGCSITLADLGVKRGHLREARRTLERALAQAGSGVRGTADMYVGLSQLAWERNDLDSAREHLRRSDELGPRAGLPQNAYRWRVAMARVREAEGDLAGARELLDEAIQVYVGDFSPDVRPVPAMRARVLAAQGDLAAAHDWIRQQGLSVEDEPSYLYPRCAASRSPRPRTRVRRAPRRPHE
jgi:LuxR family maltose regulon positive regulatory protein